MMIYPYVSLLSDAEAEEWNQFVVSARSNRKKVLGLTDIELLLRLASELVCQLPRNAEFIDAEGNHLGYGVNRITRFSAREERRKNLQFRYLNIEECQELKELSFSDVEDLSVEDIKKQYLCASLPMARKAFREDHVAMTELVAGPEIPDDYLDAIFCLAWKKELQLWCLWWTQNKHEGERI
jgi:hypothetical protein